MLESAGPVRSTALPFAAAFDARRGFRRIEFRVRAAAFLLREHARIGSIERATWCRHVCAMARGGCATHRRRIDRYSVDGNWRCISEDARPGAAGLGVCRGGAAVGRRFADVAADMLATARAT
jgi:hypothetical protein